MSKNEVSVIEQEVSPLVAQAKAITIGSAEDMAGAVTFLSTLNKQLDKVTAEKEKVTKPLNEALKAERARWKPIETTLEAAIAFVRTALVTYQTEATRKAAEEQAKIIARVGEGKGHLKAETAIRKLGEIETPEVKVETDAGSVKFRTVKKFEVMDMTMLPIEYHLADETAIRKAMQEGKELAGVRYYEEQVPVNSR